MLRLICILLLWVQSVSAQQAELNINRSLEAIFSRGDLASLSNPEDAKLRIQVSYGLKMVQQAISYLTLYQIKNNNPVSVEEFQFFSDRLLAFDPFVQCIEYEPQQLLNITFQENLWLSPQLNGLTFSYQYQAGLWRFSHYELARKNSGINASDETGLADDNLIENGAQDTENLGNSDVFPEALKPETDIAQVGFAAPYHLDVLYAYGIITHHCQTPIHYQTEQNKLFDDDWCPVWLDLIMSP
ncbi:hypothetical protein [Candidatus Albibeggiatoa sp. nov. BB20]|uniref:hypothetical protein n=1 Tax=Candidatus Albibeggiatoa sp. nov. BB20 TaxID=3162723 RepID=UPI003365338E